MCILNKIEKKKEFSTMYGDVVKLNDIEEIFSRCTCENCEHFLKYNDDRDMSYANCSMIGSYHFETTDYCNQWKSR